MKYKTFILIDRERVQSLIAKAVSSCALTHGLTRMFALTIPYTKED